MSDRLTRLGLGLGLAILILVAAVTVSNIRSTRRHREVVDLIGEFVEIHKHLAQGSLAQAQLDCRILQIIAEAHDFDFSLTCPADAGGDR